MKGLRALFWYVTGFAIVPFLCLVTPKDSRHWRYLDNIYGNPYDPIGGDAAYQAKFFKRFRWTQLRNPINQLLRSLGPCGEVEKVWKTKYTDHAIIGGKHYYSFQFPLVFGFYFWWGYKLLDDWRPRERPHGDPVSKLIVGHKFDNQMMFWFLKNKNMRVVLNRKE